MIAINNMFPRIGGPGHAAEGLGRGEPTTRLPGGKMALNPDMLKELAVGFEKSGPEGFGGFGGSGLGAVLGHMTGSSAGRLAASGCGKGA
jgi:hypothetical protein